MTVALEHNLELVPDDVECDGWVVAWGLSKLKRLWHQGGGVHLILFSDHENRYMNEPVILRAVG